MPFLGWNRRLRDFPSAQKHQRNAHPKGGCAGCDAPRPRKGNNQSATSGRTTDPGQALCAAPTPAPRWARMALGPARSISKDFAPSTHPSTCAQAPPRPRPPRGQEGPAGPWSGAGASSQGSALFPHSLPAQGTGQFGSWRQHSLSLLDSLTNTLATSALSLRRPSQRSPP